jgi:hypothetical protein
LFVDFVRAPLSELCPLCAHTAGGGKPFQESRLGRKALERCLRAASAVEVPGEMQSESSSEEEFPSDLFFVGSREAVLRIDVGLKQLWAPCGDPLKISFSRNLYRRRRRHLQ